jgi:hypothetical protein
VTGNTLHVQITDVGVSYRVDHEREIPRILALCDAYRRSECVPPIRVARGPYGPRWWIKDGYHRIHALTLLGRTTVDITVDSDAHPAWEAM